MSDRHVDGFHALARTDHLAHQLSLVDEPNVASTAKGRLAVVTDETALRAADRREIERHAQVAGEAEATRMRAALAVAQDQVGQRPQAVEGLDDGRQLAEGQVAGDVREPRPGLHALRLDDLEGPGVEDDDRGEEVRAAPVVADVRAGHVPDLSEVVAIDDAGAKALLERPGLGDGRLHRYARACHAPLTARHGLSPGRSPHAVPRYHPAVAGEELQMILDRFSLTDRVAVVTGAGKGIGAGIALALAEAGANVVCAARTESALEAVAERIRSLGRRALVVPCDVNERAQLETLAARTIEHFGRVDVLINNAGGAPPKPFSRTSEKSFEDAFHFNVTSGFVASRLLVPHMLAGDGGSIVNISSALSHRVEKAFVAYGTAKAAVNHMTELLAYELAPKVRVNAIAVGSIETEALTPFLSNGGLREKMEALTPMARLGTPEDIAAMALYLASPASSWVTGKIFEVDGGCVASNWPLDLSGA